MAAFDIAQDTDDSSFNHAVGVSVVTRHRRRRHRQSVASASRFVAR